MKKTVWLLSIWILLGLNFSCSKADEEPGEKFLFHSLISEKDLIMAGEQTKITADVTGGNPTYTWSADAGRLDPADKPFQVIFSAGECELGIRKVTCKVTSSNQSETKDVLITVYD
ncbi:MAG: hypothetical protein GX820_01435 [Bacteroidales bacterium]|nr:hypothetical protein [Bacteroidales bacterium]